MARTVIMQCAEAPNHKMPSLQQYSHGVFQTGSVLRLYNERANRRASVAAYGLSSRRASVAGRLQ